MKFTINENAAGEIWIQAGGTFIAKMEPGTSKRKAEAMTAALNFVDEVEGYNHTNFNAERAEALSLKASGIAAGLNP